MVDRMVAGHVFLIVVHDDGVADNLTAAQRILPTARASAARPAALPSVGLLGRGCHGHQAAPSVTIGVYETPRPSCRLAGRTALSRRHVTASLGCISDSRSFNLT